MPSSAHFPCSSRHSYSLIPSPPSQWIIMLLGFMLVIGTPLLVDSEDTSTKMSTTVYVIQLNASASTDNNGGFYQSANMAAGLMSVANDSSGTTKSPMTTTKKPQTTTASTQSSSTTTKLSDQPQPQSQFVIWMKYGMALPLNLLCTFLQLYVSIFGRRMHMNGLRWFTIYYNLWNVYQMLLVADTTESSPWRGLLNDTRLAANKESLELFTMTFFPLGICLLVPLLLLSHFCFCCPLRWILWLPLFILLSLIPTFLYNGGFIFNFPMAQGNITVDIGANGTAQVLDVFQVYAFSIISLATVSVLYLIPMVIVATFFFLCYRLLNRFNPKSNHNFRSSRIIDLILLLPFLVVVLAMHLPCFVQNLTGFFLINIYPWFSKNIIPIIFPPPAAPAAGGGSSGTTGATSLIPSWMLTALNLYNQIISYKDVSEMFLPVVEFLASFLFIRMYREQYLALLTCYAFYKEEKDGAFGACCSRRHPSTIVPLPTTAIPEFPLQTPDPRLWAQPVVRK